MLDSHRIKTRFGAEVLAAAETLVDGFGLDVAPAQMLDLAACQTDAYAQLSAISLVSQAVQALIGTLDEMLTLADTASERTREKIWRRRVALEALLEAIRQSPQVAALAVTAAA